MKDKDTLYLYTVILSLEGSWCFISTTQKYNNTNYTENMMLVQLEDKTKQIHINFQILIYFIVIF